MYPGIHSVKIFFVSVGDDQQICLWDTLTSPDHTAQTIFGAHRQEINCTSFSPANEFLLAAGSADRSVAIWDLRK